MAFDFNLSPNFSNTCKELFEINDEIRESSRVIETESRIIIRSVLDLSNILVHFPILRLNCVQELGYIDPRVLYDVYNRKMSHYHALV